MKQALITKSAVRWDWRGTSWKTAGAVLALAFCAPAFGQTLSLTSGTMPILTGAAPVTFSGDLALAGGLTVRVGTAEYLLVGGGGGGQTTALNPGSNQLGQGGAGGSRVAGYFDLTGTSFPVVIGGGGGAGSTGGSSSLFGVSALGGAGGTGLGGNNNGATGVAHTTITGTAYLYSGGGGDGQVSAGGRYAGGADGGGAGAGIKGTGVVNWGAEVGDANSGGGGGGGVSSSNGSAARFGAAGGSGVVFAHYYGLDTAATGGTVAEIGAGNGNYTRKFTASGTLGGLTTPTSQTAIFSGDISGGFNLSLNGPGKLILTGANSYANTTISTGTLQIGNGGTTGTLGTGSVLNNTSLRFNRSNDYLVNNSISGTGSLIQDGPGRLILSGANDYSGETKVDSGTLDIASAGSTLSTGLIQVSTLATLGGGGSGGTAAVAGTLAPGETGDNWMTLSNLGLAGSAFLSYQLHTPYADLQTPEADSDYIHVVGSLALDGMIRITNRASHATPFDFATASSGDKWLLLKYAPGNLTDNTLEIDTANSDPLAFGLKYVIETDDIFGGVYLAVAVVPEPASGLLMVFGGVLLLRRRRLR